MPKRLGIYTLGHYSSLKNAFLKKLWNPLLQNDEMWELSELSMDDEDQSIIAQTIEGMLITHEQILKGFFPLSERIACLKQIKAEFLKNFDNLVQILSMEVHKPLSIARIECERCIDTLDATIAKGEQLLAHDPTLRSEIKALRGESYPTPRKLVVGATPFNFPLNLCLHKIAPCLLAGAPLIWRPSAKGQLTALALVDVLHAARIPAGVLAFLPMSNDCFWKLLKDPRVDAVSFTGSAAVGWEIQKNFKGPTLLELGGAAPIYIDKIPSEDLKKALTEVAVSAYAFGGQSCISAQTLFLHQDIFEEGKKIIQDLTYNFATGKTWDEKTLYSSVIDEASFKRIETILEDAKKEGAIIQRAPQKELPLFVPPTLVEKPTQKLLREEVFAPVLNLMKAENFKSFKDFANELPNRLQCAVYSHDSTILEEAKTLDYGGVNLNGPSSQRIDALPYGGRGLAGLGVENPASSWAFYSVYKTFYTVKGIA